jgi:hypothetical protein
LALHTVVLLQFGRVMLIEDTSIITSLWLFAIPIIFYLNMYCCCFDNERYSVMEETAKGKEIVNETKY